MVPTCAPLGSPELDLHGLALLLVSDDWPEYGRQFSQLEWKELLLLAKVDGCKCGGVIVEDEGDGQIRYRCPSCCSDQLDRIAVGDAD
jgi:hypothetical protein